MKRELVLLALVACSDDAVDNRQKAPFVEDAGPPADNVKPPTDAAADVGDAGSDAPIVYPDPLQGTTKTATLVKNGFAFTEGPVWIGGRLLFSDIPNDVIQELLPDGNVSPFRTGSNGANGLAVDAQGRLWAAQGGNKRLTRQAGTKGATVEDVTTEYNGSQYNAPNDVIVRSDGFAFFTDPNYSGQPDTQNARGVYAVSPVGEVARLSGVFDQPNGIALGPDGSILYVVNNGDGRLLGASVDAKGFVGSFVEIAKVPGGDGMAVDDAGNLYVAASAGVVVLDAAGKTLGTIAVAEQPANCTFGGPLRKTLYITARTGLYRIDLNVPGLP